MNKIIFAVFMALSTSVFADRIDNMEEEGVMGFCENEKQLVSDGARARAEDVKLDFAPITQEMAVEIFKELEGGPHYELPKDHIFYDPNELNERELAFFKEWISEGWNKADSLIADFTKHNPDATSVILTPGAIDTIAQHHFKMCLQRRAKQRSEQRTENYIHRAASSEHLYRYSPNTPQQEYCTDIAVKYYNQCMSGVLVK